ncbi:MAG: enoyl-CoA hydratase-related protein [Salinisphaera sp.]|nr:enoyl-CoA hydratase-related protein [Salinisphaera sp.]
MRLQSYAQGDWQAGSGEATVLASAVSGEPVAQIARGGLDYALTCKEKNPREGASYGELRWDTTVTNQDDATASAKFVEPFCKLGLIPDTGGTYFLPRLVGSARAMGLAMLGEGLTAQQVADWGLIWKCVDDDAFAGELERPVEHLAAAPTKGLARTKRLLQASADNPLDTQLDLERDAMRELGRSHDYREGVAAFMEKRRPVFRGE